MFLSMTGYGKGEAAYGDKVISVELRALNGKMADIRIKSPMTLGSRELDLRRLIQDGAVRGKLDVTIEIQDNVLQETGIPNATVIREYFTALQTISKGFAVSDDAIFQAVLRLPNILQSTNGEISPEDWTAVSAATQSALRSLQAFREIEGEILRNDLRGRILEILDLLKLVDADEADRQTAFRERLAQKFTELRQEGLDENRLEQEMLYYLDKLDVNEEKVRLQQHCLYFLDAMESDEVVKGKKLNFISQEIGREMNTLGAKAQWTSIQHNVVTMKNALEEIKEQLANAL
jgi:uncharacterized protein (TIGR00255 family)